jgi:hypothetical protein
MSASTNLSLMEGLAVYMLICEAVTYSKRNWC